MHVVSGARHRFRPIGGTWNAQKHSIMAKKTQPRTKAKLRTLTTAELQAATGGAGSIPLQGTRGSSGGGGTNN